MRREHPYDKGDRGFFLGFFKVASGGERERETRMKTREWGY